jgi:hypothetical protein
VPGRIRYPFSALLCCAELRGALTCDQAITRNWADNQMWFFYLLLENNKNRLFKVHLVYYLQHMPYGVQDIEGTHAIGSSIHLLQTLNYVWASM